MQNVISHTEAAMFQKQQFPTMSTEGHFINTYDISMFYVNRILYNGYIKVTP